MAGGGITSGMANQVMFFKPTHNNSGNLKVTLNIGLVISHIRLLLRRFFISLNYFVANWLLSTNHKRIAVMYFLFVLTTAFSGLALATVIRVELAIPGLSFLDNNSEKYLTIVSLHAIVMVFFVVIPVLFGGFGNFLLPTQLGVRDVAFPRLNSFMFWVTPSGFVLLLHIFMFDKSPSKPFETSGSSLQTKIKPSFNNHVIVEAVRKLRFAVASRVEVKVKSITATKNWCRYRIFGDRGRYPSQVYIGDIYKKKIYPKKIGDGPVIVVEPTPTPRVVKQVKTGVRSRDSRYHNSDLVSLVSPYSFVRKQTWSKVSTWGSSQLIPGWAFITPYSSRLRFTALGKVDIALLVVFAAGLGSIFSAVNYVITYRCVSAPSFKNRRELRSFFADSLLVGSRMMIAANPALLIAIVFLLSDRHLGTSIFDFSGGGDAVLFQHLFWFFGHPEVYIIIIPCFGFANSILPHLLRKRLSGRLSLQYSMYTIGFMGFAVWGHHMYMVGLANTTRTLYSTMTVMISVPASTKVLHWCVTLVNSAPQFDVSLLFILAFTYFFTLGGLSGMFNAHIGFDVSLHDTFYVIGHFHVMLAGAAVSCIFAAFYFYFGSIFGVSYSKTLGTLHFVFYFFGQIFTVVPMIWLGYAGMPRRIMDYPAFFGGWHSIISGGHLLSVIAFLIFIVTLVESFVEGRTPTSRTLGVSRLNNRLSFYAYERRKLSMCKTSIVSHHSVNVPHDHNFEYLFDVSGNVTGNKTHIKMAKRKAWRWGKRSFFSVSKQVRLFSLDGICVGSGFPNVNILRSLPQKYTIRQKLIDLSLSSERRFPPVSSKVISFGTYVIGWVLADVAKRKRFIISLPVNGQRTRSNAKTMRVLKIQPFDAIVRRLGTARRCVGRQMGSDAKQKKIKAKLRPKLQKSKTNVRKKPVIRSKDTKKSVWR